MTIGGSLMNIKTTHFLDLNTPNTQEQISKQRKTHEH